MARAPEYSLVKVVPNAKLLRLRGFGEILLGCPSEVIKPLIKKDHFPDYCVLTLRTMREGRNLLDVEFLFYMIAFFRERAGEKFRFVCTRYQRDRILTVLRETLYGPRFPHLFGALLPDETLRLSDVPAEESADPLSRRQAAAAQVLAQLEPRRERVDRLFTAGMEEGLTTEQLVRRLSPEFRGLPGVRAGKHARAARAWVQAKCFRRESEHFGSYPEDPEAAINRHIDFVLFDEEGVATLTKNRRTVRIRQVEACFFEVEHRRGKRLEVDMRVNEPPADRTPRRRRPFVPPELGVTFLGSGTGFSPGKLTTSTVVWAAGLGIAIDLVAESTARLRQLGISRGDVSHVILTHVHGDHDAGLFQRILAAGRIRLLTTRVIYESFLRKAEAVTCLPQQEFRKLLDFTELAPGRAVAIPGVAHTSVRCAYTFHPLPTIGVILDYRPPGEAPQSIAVSGDTLYDPDLLHRLTAEGRITPDRREAILDFLWEADLVVHEAGGAPIHTEVETLGNLPAAVRKKLYLNHIAVPEGRCGGMRVAREGQTVTLRKSRNGARSPDTLEMLKATGLFDHLSTRSLEALRRRGKVARHRAGTAIVREREKGDEFYVLLNGLAVAEKDGTVVNEYEPGDFFGERAIVMPDHRRAATVRAQTDVRLFVMPEELYREYHLPDMGEANLYNLVNFFSERTAPALLSSLASGEMQQYSRGEDIILLGARDRTAYVLLSGMVEALDEEEHRLGVVQDVDIFGEIASLERVPRTATVRAQTDVKVLKIEERQFRELLRRFPGFYATVLQKKRVRLHGRDPLDHILQEEFGFH